MKAALQAVRVMGNDSLVCLEPCEMEPGHPAEQSPATVSSESCTAEMHMGRSGGPFGWPLETKGWCLWWQHGDGFKRRNEPGRAAVGCSLQWGCRNEE